MILVTGAAGKTGRAVIRALVARGVAVRALAFRPTQVQPLKELGAQEVAVGDMRHPATVGHALQGIRAVYFICSNLSPDELAIGQLLVKEAGSVGVRHFVYHSVLHPHTEEMPHHWQKLRVEECLFKSDLPYTILQPAAYMQNVLSGWQAIVGRGVYRVPYAAETRLGMVDLEDVAAAAAVVLIESGHEGAAYELAGSETLTQTEIAALLSRALGQTVRVEVLSLEEWKERARVSGLGDYQIETLAKMFRYYEDYGFWGNPNVLGWLIGRAPTTFEAFIERVTQETRVRSEALR